MPFPARCSPSSSSWPPDAPPSTRTGSSPAAWPRAPTISPVPGGASGKLDAATRAAAFDYVWRTIDEARYNPKMNGVDWKAAGEKWRPQVMDAPDDDAFWDRLDRMAGELRDAHTRVESPKRAQLIERAQSVSLGFSFRPLGDALVVTNVNGESDAWWAGVRPGMTLTTVEAFPRRMPTRSSSPKRATARPTTRST